MENAGLMELLRPRTETLFKCVLVHLSESTRGAQDNFVKSVTHTQREQVVKPRYCVCVMII